MASFKLMAASMLAGTVLTTGMGGFTAAIAADGDPTGLSCTSSAVTLNGGSYTACEGAFSGNDTGSKGTLLTKLNTEGLFADLVGTGTWTVFGKSDEEGAVDADNGKVSGSWDTDLSTAGAFDAIVVSLKSSTSYSTYLFTENLDEVINGTFTMDGVSVNKKGKAQALSHMTVAYFQRETPAPPKPVDEPATALGLGLASLGMVLVRRRQA